MIMVSLVTFDCHGFLGAIFRRENLGVHSAVGEGAGVEDKEVLGGV